MRLNVSEFRKFLTSIAAIGNDAYITYDNGFLNCKLMNAAGSAMCNITLAVGSDGKDLQVDVNRFNEFCKSINTEEIDIEGDGPYNIKGGGTKFTIPQLTINKPRDPPEFDLPVSIVISTKDIMAKYKTVLLIEDFLMLNYIDKKLTLSAKSEWNPEEIESAFSVISVERDTDEECKGKFLPNIVGPVLQQLVSFDKIRIEMGDKTVMALSGSSDNLTIKYIIAPCIDD